MRFALIACGVSLLGLGLATACSSPTIHTIDLTEGDGGPATSKSPTNPTPGTSGGTSGTSGTSGTTGNTTCDKICAAAASANCSKQSTCVADCEADSAKIPAGCKTEADAVQACAAKATSFKCSSSGKATVASGCDDEGNALLTCLTSGGSSGSSGTSGSSGGNCGNLQSGIAACDTCQASKCCAQGAACTANAACGDIIDCLSTNNCTTQACFTQCENAHPAGKAAEQAFYGCLQTNCSAACQ